MNTDTDFPTLLHELFHGNSRQLRVLLQPLTADQRRALFSEFKELLNVLKRACRFQADAKAVSLSELYRALCDDPVGFLRDRADTLAAPGTLNNSQWMRQLFYNQLMEFYSRLQLLQAGLAGKGGVAGVFRYSERYPVWPAQFILHAGRVLLDRPESWACEALGQIFTDLERRTRFAGADLGVAPLLREARQRHPDWADALAPYLGPAMRHDGFFRRTLDGYDADMILAGLEYDPPASGEMTRFEPLMDPKVVEALLTRMADGRLSRTELIALSLRKLHGPLRPGVAKTWIDFFQKLVLSDAEIREQGATFISLLNAPAPAAVKLALSMVEKHFLADADRTDELIGALGYLLQNPVQILAKSGLRLLKKLHKARSDSAATVLNAAMAGLGSPHAALRNELARWLSAFPASAWSKPALATLQELAAGLPLAEQTPLAHLLTVTSREPPAAHDDMAPDTAPPDLHAILRERTALLQQRLLQQPADDLLRRRLAVLQGYLTTGQPPLLTLTIPDDAAARSAADFALHETAEAVALDLARTRRRLFTLADYDRILAGMTRFAPDECAGRTHAILAPLLARLDDWRQPPTGGGASFSQTGELSGLILACAWQTGEPPDFPKGSRGEQCLPFSFSPALQRRLKYVLKLRAAGHETLLSIPTHAAGWLSPEVFAERFARLPRPLLDADELATALYRLPALSDARAAAWVRLAGLIDSRSEGLDEGVALALAPDERAMRALEWFLERFARQPPNERLFQSLAGFGGGDNWAEAFRVKVLHQTPDAPENAAFRLFNAALRCRFGLGDAGISDRVSALTERLAPHAGWLSRVLQQPGTDSSPFAELLFNPRSVTEALAEAAHAAVAGFSFVHDSPFPFLWPYLLAHPHQFATPERVADLAYQFPPLAQRLFEAGLCRLGRKEDYYRDLTRSLLAQGHWPQVDVLPHLFRVGRGLSVTHTALREQCVDLIAQWLTDGRITPVDGASLLAALIRETGQGFAHLDQALASLSVSGALGRGTVLLGLEQALGNGVADFPPRKLSLLLDRLGAVLQDAQCGVGDPAARRALETLAAAKKSVSRDKASAALTRSADTPPAWVLALATHSGGR